MNNLFEKRRQAADSVYEEFEFQDGIVGAHNGWETSGDQWLRSVFLENEANSQTKMVHFQVSFVSDGIGIESFGVSDVEYSTLSPAFSMVAENYWYDLRDDLQSDMVFLTNDGVVKLDRRVPGDGTKWYAATWEGSWAFNDDTVEPGDLLSMQIDDNSVDINNAWKSHLSNRMSNESDIPSRTRTVSLDAVSATFDLPIDFGDGWNYQKVFVTGLSEYGNFAQDILLTQPYVESVSIRSGLRCSVDVQVDEANFVASIRHMLNDIQSIVDAFPPREDRVISIQYSAAHNFAVDEYLVDEETMRVQNMPYLEYLMAHVPLSERLSELKELKKLEPPDPAP